jgi:tyrosyl-tRNA synthetase
MAINTDKKAIAQLLTLGVSDVIVKEDLEKKLASGKKLRIKLGIDPTGFDLHLGHMVVVHKLREFQDLGHQIVLLFGNFTGQIGDPTGKDQTRALRTQEELEKNAEHYLKQVSSILDVKKVEVRWNADWLAPMSFADVTHLASQFTVAQMLERDMFQKRIADNKPISVHEFMYPLMQGYDSVALKADVELGGTDQTFNMLAGRVIQRAYDQDPQNVMAMPILVGTDGVMKMGKTTGNYIGVDESPEEIFGKIMSIPDEVILRYFELAGRVTFKEYKALKARLEGGENPRNLKMELGERIIEIYHGKKAAEKGRKHFETVFQKKALPEDIKEVALAKKHQDVDVISLLDILNMIASKSDGRRLIQGGAVKIDGKKIGKIDVKIKIPKGKTLLIQVGKRKFIRVHRKDG